MSGESFPSRRVVALDGIEAVPTPAGLSWRPVRAALGVRAFGVGGYTADAGQTVIEAHTESGEGRGHEELYFVVRGSARFALDGESFDVIAGTFVFVPEPAVHRHALALQDGTEVLAFGGDRVFDPAGDEWIWRVRPLLPDQLDRAQALVDEGLAELPENPGVWYAQALVAAAGERREQARSWLAKALDREPRLLQEARAEPLLAALAEELV